nr:uncharacterized mitochondrial protein AtMg00810-like [Tanacetum cinerariifolium]
MSDMGELTFFLGLQVEQLLDGIFISQDKYIKDMLKNFDMESVRTTTTPYEVPKHKSKDDPDDAINVYLFRSMIGSLIYLTASRPDIMFSVSACSRHQVLLLVVLVRADDLVPAGSCIIPTGSYSFMLMTWFLLLYYSYWWLLVHADEFVPAGRCTITTVSSSFILLDWFLLDDHNKVAYLEKGKGWEAYEQILDFLNRSHIRLIMDGMIGNIGSKRHKFLMYPRFLQMILGIQTSDPSLRPTFDFTAKLFSNMKLNWDGPHMLLLASMLVVPAGGDGADAVAAGAAVAHDGANPSKGLIIVRDPTPVRDLTPSPVREPTPDSPRPPSPPPRTEEVSPTTSTRPPSPTRHTSVHDDISEGGGDFVSLPQSNEALQTPAATAAGGAEDSSALTALSLKLDRCLHRVTTLENELGITKKVLGGVILKLVTRVKRLVGLLQQRKQRLVLSDFEGDDATPTEHDIDLASLHTLAHASLGSGSFDQGTGPDAIAVHAATTMPFRSTSTTRRRLRKTFTTSTCAHVPENIPAGASVPVATTTIPAGSSVDAAIHAAAAPSSSIPTAADKGKAPMVDDSLPADLLSEQERVLKNLHDSQLGEELAKKIHVEQEDEFARQQEELAQKAQAERVASPTEHGPGMADQRRQELDAALLIYTEADWLVLMLLLRKRRELAEQSRVKPMTKTQQRDYIRDFVKNNSASVYNQGWTMKKVKALSIAQLRLEFDYIQQHLERSNLLNFRHSTFQPKPTLDAPSAKRANQGASQVPSTSSQVPASVPAALSFPADVSVHTATSSAPADILLPAVSPTHAAASVPAETVVHTAESHLDDPLTASEHVSTAPSANAPTPLSSRKRRKHIAKKWVTPIVDMADALMIKFDSDSDDDPLPYAPYAGWEMVPSPLGSVHAYSNMARHTKHFTTLRELLHMSLDDEDALDFWRNQDNWRIHSWRLYPRAQVHVLKIVDGRVIHMFVDVFYPLIVATLERMLKHGLEVLKLLVGGDLTMAEQLIAFIKAALLNA